MTQRLKQRLVALETSQSSNSHIGMVICQYDDNGVLIERSSGKPIEPDDHRRKLIVHVVKNQTPRIE
jgi:hypothetical protein